MSIHDIVTLGLSGAALVLSLVATAISLVQRQREKERGVRQQLTDVVTRLVDIRVRRTDLLASPQRDSLAQQNISAVLNDITAALADQATYLMRQVEHLVTDTEYGTVAGAYGELGNPINAEEFWQKCLRRARGPQRILALRGYATMLFDWTEYERGRSVFRQAVNAVSGDDEYAMWTNGYTYQTWAASEAAAGFRSLTEPLIAQAQQHFERMRNPGGRQAYLDGLAGLRQFCLESTKSDMQPQVQGDKR